MELLAFAHFIWKQKESFGSSIILSLRFIEWILQPSAVVAVSDLAGNRLPPSPD
jgi:hypothetical protein